MVHSEQVPSHPGSLPKPGSSVRTLVRSGENTSYRNACASLRASFGCHFLLGRREILLACRQKTSVGSVQQLPAALTRNTVLPDERVRYHHGCTGKGVPVRSKNRIRRFKGRALW